MRRWSVNLLEASAAGCQRFWQIINENINAVKCSRIEKSLDLEINKPLCLDFS